MLFIQTYCSNNNNDKKKHNIHVGESLFIVPVRIHGLYILANFQISERGTNERKKFKKRNIPKFPIHYYTKIAAKTGTHDKIILFFASKRGTVPPKEEQLASMAL